jgi:hypothetical protein
MVYQPAAPTFLTHFLHNLVAKSPVLQTKFLTSQHIVFTDGD